MAGTVQFVDESAWSETIARAMREAGFVVLRASGAEGSERLLRRRLPDLVFVVESGRVDALRTTRWLRQMCSASLTIVMPAATEERLLAAFTAGADDVVPPDIAPPVLVARSRSLLRRLGVDAPPAGTAIAIGDVTLDPARQRVLIRDRAVHFSPLEYALLLTLMRDPGVVYSREDLLDAVWGSREIGVERTVDAHVWKLRRKIERHGGCPEHIESVRHLGYRFRRPSELEFSQSATA
jgi:DNA-binding response OmpR family regulator